MADTRGARRALRSFFVQCWVYGGEGIPRDDARAEGIRTAALAFLNSIREAAPEALLLMEQEHAEDEAEPEEAEEPDAVR